MRTDRMFKEAKKQARLSACGYRMGAVVAHSKVLGRGKNKSKSHTSMQGSNKPWLRGIHAELAACLSGGVRKIKGADLFVCRILKDESFAIARPCKACLKIAQLYGIRRVYYTISDTEFGVIYG